ncbi:hypothetical protein CCANI_05965 [Corynebacterium canis]|nr:hypothetical protein CCANI_05965 [Corynebacterium canis]
MAVSKKPVADTTEEGWIDAGTYSFKLEDGNILARNAKGKLLKTVPAKAKRLEQFEQLDGLRVFLAQHEEQCLEFVRRWFLESLPVPLSVICSVWPDPAWRKFLNDVIVSDGQVTGFLRAADDAGIQIVDLDGESTTIPYSDSATVLIQHPAIMEDLEDWREFAVELGVTQGLDQLFRDVYLKPADADGRLAAVTAYSNGKYSRAATLIGRSRGAGFKVTLNSVSIDVREDGETVTATLEISAWSMDDSASLGRLTFAKGYQSLAAEDVGPIAWSEGIRMCEFVYAGRSVEKQEGE